MKRLTLVMCTLAIIGCGDDDTGGDTGPTDGGMDMAVRPDGNLIPDRGTPDMILSPDMTTTPDQGTGSLDNDNDFATATPFAGESISGVINPAGDEDYYQLTGQAGRWLVINTFGNPPEGSMDDPSADRVDTVVTVFDSTMTKVAESDDSVPRFGPNSELLYRFPADGMYFVRVQEYSSWDLRDMMAAPDPVGSPDFEYSISAGILGEEQAEVGNDASTAGPLGLAPAMGNADLSIGSVWGSLADAADVDVYSFTTTRTENLSVFYMPTGVDGYGSTTAHGNVWITQAAGPIVARLATNATGGSITAFLPAGDYHLWIDNGSDAGANDFYFLRAFGVELNGEADDAANNALAGAQTVMLETIPPTGVMAASRATFSTQLITDTDVDYFSFEVPNAADMVGAACFSSNLGSGVQGLTVELRDAADAVLATGTPENATMGSGFDALAAPAAGVHYLRVAKTGQAADVVGTHVSCTVTVFTP